MYRTESFTHRGRTIVYDTYGSDGPVVIYLHALLLDSEVNRGIAEAIAGLGHRVVLVDLLGHGRSDRPTHASSYRIDSYADQVFDLMDHLGIDDAVLGGISLGANVSLYAASQRPERVRGLILEMPVMERAVPPAASLFVPLLLAAHYGRGVLRLVAAALRRVPDGPWGPVNSIVHAGATPPEVMSAVLHGVLVGPVVPTGDERAAITTPTLVLGHRNDLIHPFGDAENLAAQLPGARLLAARSPIELRLHPERLTTEITAFVDGLADRTELTGQS